MPTIVRWTIRTALIFFVVALSAMLLDAAQQAEVVTTQIPALRPVGLHLLMVGWASQMIMGVGLWMFPKYSVDRPRGNEIVAWTSYGLLNAGLVIRAFGEPLTVSAQGQGWGWLLAVSALLQFTAGWLFIGNTWPRLRGR